VKRADELKAAKDLVFCCYPAGDWDRNK